MKEKTAGERIRAIRGERSQEEFGKLLDSSQGAVSAWERDDRDRSPSAAVYFRLAALARNPDDAIFFLEQAGLEPQTVASVSTMLLRKGLMNMDNELLTIAEEKLKGRIGEQKDLEEQGKVVLVPPFGEEPPAGAQPPLLVPVPAALVPHKASTYYIVAEPQFTHHRAGEGVAPGDIIVFDAYDTSLEGMLHSIGEEWLIRLPEAQYRGSLFLGRLGEVKDAKAARLLLAPMEEHPYHWQPRQEMTQWGEVRTVWDGRYVELFRSGPPNFDDYQPSREFEVLGTFIERLSTGAIGHWKLASRKR